MKQFCKACICEYNGTNYAGWQRQSSLRTVQGEIESALAILYQEPITILGSGRTDSGVHALGQVFSYRTDTYRSNRSIVQALNNSLPQDISIISAYDVATDFHPIASAQSKTYRYDILNRETRSGIDYDRVWHRREDIDIDKLSAILNTLIGTHDFSSFCMLKSVKENSVRTINFIDISKNGDIISVRINADGFLHNMVRVIIGTAVHMAANGATPQDMLDALAYKDRKRAGITAPPQGLYLEKVYYNHEFMDDDV